MHSHGIAAGYADLLDRIHAFVTATGSAFGPGRRGHGDGRLVGYSGGADSVAELITITAANSAGVFSVFGSESGDLGHAQVGVPFSSSKVAFTIQDGSTNAFRASDVLTINTASAWEAKRVSAGAEYIWTAPGNDGKAEIYCGMLAHIGAGYSILRVNGMTGFNASLNFYKQPGSADANSTNPLISELPGISVGAGNIEYWLVADGRRLIVIAKVDGRFQAAYLGLANPVIAPDSYPLPLVVAGTVLRQEIHTSDITNNTCFPFARQLNQLRMRSHSGTWQRYTQGQDTSGTQPQYAYGNMYPYFKQKIAGLALNLDGSRPLIPLTLHSAAPQEIMATLAGIDATPGIAGLVPGQLLESALVDRLVVPDVYRTGPADFFTVTLD